MYCISWFHPNIFLFFPSFRWMCLGSWISNICWLFLSIFRFGAFSVIRIFYPLPSWKSALKACAASFKQNYTIKPPPLLKKQKQEQNKKQFLHFNNIDFVLVYFKSLICSKKSASDCEIASAIKVDLKEYSGQYPTSI